MTTTKRCEMHLAPPVNTHDNNQKKKEEDDDENDAPLGDTIGESDGGRDAAVVYWDAGKAMNVEEIQVNTPKAGEVRVKRGTNDGSKVNTQSHLVPVLAKCVKAFRSHDHIAVLYCLK
ncbi:hypothetical protein LguiA_017384 [Lonicera macranthoides]